VDEVDEVKCRSEKRIQRERQQEEAKTNKQTNKQKEKHLAVEEEKTDIEVKKKSKRGELIAKKKENQKHSCFLPRESEMSVTGLLV
jgi:hypothetical protein